MQTAIPFRSVAPKPDKPGSRIYFVNAKTAQGKALLQSQRMATLFIDVLRSFSRDRRFKVHEFVVMRNYVQLLLTVNGENTVDDILRRIKRRFAFQATWQFAIKGWIWAFDITAVEVRNRADFLKHKAMMEEKPVKSGMAQSADAYPYCSAYLRKNKAVAGSARGPS